MPGNAVRITGRAAVTTTLTVEYDRIQGKLRIGDDRDTTLAVYSRGEVYRVAPIAGEGCVNIPDNADLPGLVRNLRSQHIVEVIETLTDYANYDQVAVCRVLI